MQHEGDFVGVRYVFWWSFCWLILPFVELSVRLLGYRRSRWLATWLARLLGAVHTRKAQGEWSSISRARRFATIIEHANQKSLLRYRCLARSLLLWMLLKAHQIDSEVCIGVARQDDSLNAHAWVECGGIPVNERETIDEVFGKLIPQKAASQ